jgi:hypothetical protein
VQTSPRIRKVAVLSDQHWVLLGHWALRQMVFNPYFCRRAETAKYSPPEGNLIFNQSGLRGVGAGS